MNAKIWIAAGYLVIVPPIATFALAQQPTPVSTDTPTSLETAHDARVKELTAYLAAADAKTAPLKAQIKTLQDQVAAIEGTAVPAARRELRVLGMINYTSRPRAPTPGAQ